MPPIELCAKLKQARTAHLCEPSRFGTTTEEKSVSHKISVVIEKDEFGYYAYSPELDGSQTQGDTLEEVIDHMREAVDLYLETITEEEVKEVLSKEILTTTLEVKVA